MKKAGAQKVEGERKGESRNANPKKTLNDLKKPPTASASKRSSKQQQQQETSSNKAQRKQADGKSDVKNEPEGSSETEEPRADVVIKEEEEAGSGSLEETPKEVHDAVQEKPMDGEEGTEDADGRVEEEAKGESGEASRTEEEGSESFNVRGSEGGEDLSIKEAEEEEEGPKLDGSVKIHEEGPIESSINVEEGGGGGAPVDREEEGGAASGKEAGGEEVDTGKEEGKEAAAVEEGGGGETSAKEDQGGAMVMMVEEEEIDEDETLLDDGIKIDAGKEETVVLEQGGGAMVEEEAVGGPMAREEGGGGAMAREEGGGGAMAREEGGGGAMAREEGGGGAMAREEGGVENSIMKEEAADIVGQSGEVKASGETSALELPQGAEGKESSAGEEMMAARKEGEGERERAEDGGTGDGLKVLEGSAQEPRPSSAAEIPPRPLSRALSSLKSLPHSSASSDPPQTFVAAPQEKQQRGGYVKQSHEQLLRAGQKLREMLEESKKRQQAMFAENVAPPLLLPPKILDVDDKIEPEKEVLEVLVARKDVERKAMAEKLKQEMEKAEREYQEAKHAHAPAPKLEDEPGEQGERAQEKQEEEGKGNGEPGLEQAEPSPHKFRSLSVYVGTWNLGGGSCPSMSLASWLSPDQFDIYAIGAQELEGLPGLSTASERPRWEAAMTSHMGKEYELIAKHCLGTTHLMCFIRKDLLPHVSDVHHAHVITGFGRVIANKSGIGICFDIFSTSFLFVTAHFAAGSKPKSVKARNEDFFRIDSGLVPLMCPIVAHRLNELKDGSTTHTGRWSVSSLFDRVFWLGDFNYRVQATYEDAIGKLEQGKRAALLLLDELTEERENARVFPSFEEASISFNPTYKFEAWTDQYESVKKRVPSWTDRILFRAAPGQEGSIEAKAYGAASSIMASDHRPVFAHFQVSTKRDASTAGESRGATTSGSAACVIL